MIKRLLTGLISLYKTFISPVLPPSCRFYPSCSAYASEAVETHGAVRGTWLAVKRLLRCHPFNPGGYDPVPGGDFADPIAVTDDIASRTILTLPTARCDCGRERLGELHRHNGL